MLIKELVISDHSPVIQRESFKSKMCKLEVRKREDHPRDVKTDIVRNSPESEW